VKHDISNKELFALAAAQHNQDSGANGILASARARNRDRMARMCGISDEEMRAEQKACEQIRLAIGRAHQSEDKFAGLSEEQRQVAAGIVSRG
jgi:hypothetical protein